MNRTMAAFPLVFLIVFSFPSANAFSPPIYTVKVRFNLSNGHDFIDMLLVTKLSNGQFDGGNVTTITYFADFRLTQTTASNITGDDLTWLLVVLALIGNGTRDDLTWRTYWTWSIDPPLLAV